MQDKPPAPVVYEPLTKSRQELYLRVVDGAESYQSKEHPITWRLLFLENHFPPDKLNRGLAWLITNRITGRNFTKWFREECKSSDLEMHRILLSVVDNMPFSPIIAGKNFKL